MRTRPSLLFLAAAATIFLMGLARADITPVKDSRLGVFDAELVAIVRQVAEGVFKVDEVLLKTVEVGEAIEVPGFKLYVYEQEPFGFGGKRVDVPITEFTRILMFLKRRPRWQDEWEVVYGYCFFWVDDLAKVDELRKEVADALDLRERWEAARDIEDPKARVASLWPFLWDNGSACCRLTQTELQKAGEVAGDYIAERLALLSHGQRMNLLADLGLYGGEKLHSTLVSHLENRRAAYTVAVEGRDADPRAAKNEWQALTSQAREMWGELYYGLAGLAKFKDENDLPFIRDLALWAVRYRVKQTCDAALSAFRFMPAKENLPVIDAIWKEFTQTPYDGNELNPFDVARTLRAHKYPETVPVLVKLVDDLKAGSEARAFLKDIVGKDLGPDPGPWLDWYDEQTKAADPD